MSLLDLFNPIKGLVDSASEIIGKFVPDPQQKAAAQLALFQAQAQLQEAAMAAQQQFADAQAKVITAEAQSQSWLARNWRPILMLVFTFIIAWNYIAVPVFHLQAAGVPDQMWTLLNIGIGGYIGGRSLEKVAPNIVAAFKNGNGNGK